MAENIVSMPGSLSVAEQDGLLVVDSRLVAGRLGIQHENFVRTINKYLIDVQEFGVLRFENGKSSETGNGGRPERYCWLNEDQATFLMTLSRNTAEVVRCKKELTAAFKQAKQAIKTVIPAQSERIRELELELALRRLDSDMLTMHGKEVVLALRGKSDQIVEMEKPTIEVIDSTHNVKFSGQTLKQIADYLNKKYGTKFKSGADVKRFLERSKLGHLIAQTPRTVMGEYVPDEHLDFAYQALTSGDRQRLIGELT